MSLGRRMQQAAAGAGGGDFYGYTIDNSARFNDDDSAYLYRTQTTTTNGVKCTFSAWVKRGALGAVKNIFSGYYGTDADTYIYFDTSDKLRFYSRITNVNGAPAEWYGESAALFRDPSAWYHIVVKVDTSSAQASNNDYYTVYVNGVAQTFSTVSGFSNLVSAATVQNRNTCWNVSGYSQNIGAHRTSNTYDGYMAEFHYIDGTAYDASAFGQTKNGVWIPKSPSVTYGTNGFYLKFDNSGALGTDSSGNGNNWTVSGLTSSDQMNDTPTSNTATWNPISSANIPTLSNGNLDTPIENNKSANATIGVSSGLWTWEITVNNTGNPAPYIGVTSRQYEQDADTGTSPFSNANLWSVIRLNSLYKNYTATSSSALSSTQYGVVTFVLDKDNGTLKYYLNGSLIHTDSTIPTDDTVLFPLIGYTNSGGAGWQSTSANFGQSAFSYTPNASALALCTANLPEPTVGPNSTTQSDEHFNTVIFTGDGTNPRSITGVGFQPDLVWFKRRSSSGSHWLVDAVRGVSSTSSPSLSTDTLSNGAEADIYNPNGGVISFDTDGFTSKGSVGNTNINTSGITAVTWNWKGNGAGVSNTDGTITTTVSANQASGFSILKYTGNATVNATLGHGLNAVPKCALFKAKDQTYASGYDWYVYHHSLGLNQKLKLNTADAASASSNEWTTAPTSSLFYVGSGGGTNGSSLVYIAYLFAEVEGFSSFGSYTGNGSTDGPFIYTGFRPAFIITKRTDTSGYWWEMVDTARAPYNVSNKTLYANVADAEYTNSVYDKDLLSNGFKIRGTNGGQNASGGTYIYMAFAENPFKYSNAR